MLMVFIITGTIGLATVHPGHARVSPQDRFERQFQYEQIDFQLRGTALLKYLVFIKAYSGALYLPETISASRLFDSVPKRLTLEYHVSIRANDLAKATTAMIQKNVDDQVFRALKHRIDQLNRLYRDVGPQDRYSLTYIPDLGTELALNGTPLGVIPGDDFSNAVFSIWLGTNPIDEPFRDQLLGI